MASPSDARIAELLQPYTGGSEWLARKIDAEASKFRVYLDLLLRWNARTNLTSVREPEEIVRRHFGESVFAASVIERFARPGATLLDLGSGAGFPGLPVQLCLPTLSVTLAESQGKKASFLREAVRSLGLPTEVWAARVEIMPSIRQFDFVAMRAVDRMEAALDAGAARVASGGVLVVLAGEHVQTPAAWHLAEQATIPGSQARYVYIMRH